ncbi:hypothetical protein OK006_6493 [Actinobacteria bacterium OK006]|nr:hypothetical protein OK006_6493 [Actinobacteria bacterium OK006]
MSAEVFPALLAASTDPAGLRLLPTARVPAEAEEDPGTETTTAPTPAAPETDGARTPARRARHRRLRRARHTTRMRRRFESWARSR